MTHVISRDKFQPCHWPLLEYVVLYALRCVLLEIVLNAGSACVGRRGGVLLLTALYLGISNDRS